MDFTQEIIFSKIKNKEELEEHELKYLIVNNEIMREIGENKTWTRTVRSIIKLYARTYALEWDQGLTRNEEDEYHSQPYEVEEQIMRKFFEFKVWVKKGDR